jgi:hypothetical protein
MRPLRAELRMTLWLFAALALVAGVLLFVLSEETDRFFSWTIKPPLTAAFLGASYWAAFVLLAWSARQRSWARVRATMLPVLAIAVLLLIATIVHEDRFHRDLFGWFWMTVYAIVPVALAVGIWRQLRVPGSDDIERRPLPPWLRAALAVQALVMIGVGAALFLAPAEADAIWPWNLTALTARAIGAFVLGFGLAAAHAAVENDLNRFEGAAFAYTALGVLELLALARYPSDLTGGSLDSWLYAGFLAAVVAVGGYASWRALESRSVSSASSALS